MVLTSTETEHHLYMLVAKHLKENPTTEDSAMRLRVPGAPMPDMSKPYPKPAIPRGWKMNTILPYYSPAMTGGGVSENFFKDMMKEMQGQMPGMAPVLDGADAGGGGEGKKKKEKKTKA
jgi:signal recognition particle subunit SRP19